MIKNTIDNNNNSRDFAVRCELASKTFECNWSSPIAVEVVANRYASAEDMMVAMSMTEAQYNEAWNKVS